MIGQAKRNCNIERMVFIDTETKSTPIPEGAWGGSGKPFLAKLWLGWACFWDKGKETWYEFRTKEELYEQIEAFSSDRRRPVYVYTYNASFDYQILGLMDSLRTRRGWTYDRAPIIGSVFLLGCKYQGCEVWWLDMGNHLGIKRPLRDIGADLGVEKLDIDSAHLEQYSEQEVSTYCRRDVEIVRDYMLKWLNFLVENDLGAYRPTLAAQCLTAYRHRFMEKNIYVHNIKAVEEMERVSYRGGRNESFFIGKIDEDVYKVDINGFHPFIMANLNLPHKLLRAGEWISKASLDECLDNNRLFIVSCRVTVTESSRCISVKKEVEPHVYRSIFPVGTFNATITSAEYQQLYKYGGRVEDVYKFAIYESGILFKRYIDHFYRLRLRYKEDGDKTMDTMAKYFMNSLEGKLAQHNHDTIIISEQSKHKDGNYTIYDADTKERIVVQVYGGREWVRSKTSTEGYDVFVAIPSFIRAYTRVILWEDFNTIWENGGEVYYTDTDSIFTNKAGYNALLREGKVDINTLGLYKLEEVGKVTINGCKDYIFNEIEKIKGIKGNAKKVGRTYKQTHFCRMSAMLQRGIKEGVIIVEDFEKTPKRNYTKGKVLPSGFINPIVLNEEPITVLDD